MPVRDGVYEAKISTFYKEIREGIEEIEKMIGKSRKIRINNVPISLLNRFKPLLRNKDLKIILPRGVKPTKELKSLGRIATAKSRIYVEYKGREANTGSVGFPTKNFNIIWTENEILSISAVEYSACVKCLLKTFETAWRYSKKW